MVILEIYTVLTFTCCFRWKNEIGRPDCHHSWHDYDGRCLRRGVSRVVIDCRCDPRKLWMSADAELLLECLRWLMRTSSLLISESTRTTLC